ncbi:MAG TPA: hypothetical protein VF668_23390 [Pyrinomonadaceae bacterium]|jgi:hypothetical protein
MSRDVTGEPSPESLTRRLASLRAALLRLHKVLLDDERAAYERARGRVTGGEMLQLVINDERFAWLRPVSELVVGIDEALDADEPATADTAAALFAQARLLLRPSETGSEFGRKYHDALQREPAAVLAHGQVMANL